MPQPKAGSWLIRYLRLYQLCVLTPSCLPLAPVQPHLVELLLAILKLLIHSLLHIFNLEEQGEKEESYHNISVAPFIHHKCFRASTRRWGPLCASDDWAIFQYFGWHICQPKNKTVLHSQEEIMCPPHPESLACNTCFLQRSPFQRLSWPGVA